jgi:uroporphyrinogen decarboxylase
VNKVQRVREAVAGRPVDRPPFTVWYHFGLQHATADRVVQAHLEFLEAYDLDWLKLMNDYSYPMPSRAETLDDPRQLAGLVPLEIERTPLVEQWTVVEALASALRGRALIVDTVFNAWNTLRRNVVKDAIQGFMRDHPEALETALAAVNETLIRYARGSVERGAAGIFLSVPAAEEFVTREQYARFMRPHDLALLQALRGRGELHILHAHGVRLHLDPLLDYPVHALSWGDRDGGPSLAEARRRTRLALIGGLDHTRFQYTPASAIRAQVRDAVASAGRQGLLVAPGCSLATYTFPELIRAARDEVERLRE